jgi:hypothetical protein
MSTGEYLLDDDAGLDVEFVAEVLLRQESDAAAVDRQLF